MYIIPTSVFSRFTSRTGEWYPWSHHCMRNNIGSRGILPNFNRCTASGEVCMRRGKRNLTALSTGESQDIWTRHVCELQDAYGCGKFETPTTIWATRRHQAPAPGTVLWTLLPSWTRWTTHPDEELTGTGTGTEPGWCSWCPPLPTTCSRTGKWSCCNKVQAAYHHKSCSRYRRICVDFVSAVSVRSRTILFIRTHEKRRKILKNTVADY